MTDQPDGTLLTVEVFRRMLRMANHRAEEMVNEGGDSRGEYEIAHLATGLILQAANTLIPPRATTPTPSKPPAKYEAIHEGGWVVHRGESVPGQLTYVDPTGYPTTVAWETRSHLQDNFIETDLLPIPPKPDKVQQGYKLRGDVKVPDESESYICAATGYSVVRNEDADTRRAWGGRRWIVEEDKPDMPNAKFKEDDWVVAHIDCTTPGRILRHWHGHGSSQVFDIQWPNGQHSHRRADQLLPIPPRPGKVQPGYRLRGDVEVPDGSGWYVGYCGGEMLATSIVFLREDIYGGRRWMAELDPDYCPKCHKELDA